MLTSGAKLGPYEIIAPLGAGGMGEVYRAKDTRLERSVAIKIADIRDTHTGDPKLLLPRYGYES
jgi:serine/threonine protein kinase